MYKKMTSTNMKLFPAIGLTILSFCSCSGDNYIKDEIERFYGLREVLPLDSMLYVEDDSSGYVQDVTTDRYR